MIFLAYSYSQGDACNNNNAKNLCICRGGPFSAILLKQAIDFDHLPLSDNNVTSISLCLAK
jgi:hypothetical protein